MRGTFLEERIAKIKALIVAYEDALLALGTSGTQSYKLDTGQTVTTVTKANVEELKGVLDGLYNQCATLEARLTGNGTLIGGPAW